VDDGRFFLRRILRRERGEHEEREGVHRAARYHRDRLAVRGA
jgi:hypothetical protein